MKKYFVEELSFYITNECNLSCDNCVTYNNLDLTGHHELSDNVASLKQWSKILTVDRIWVLGGETFLHPDFDSWIKTVRELWPECEHFRVSTNGLTIKSHIDKIRQYIDIGIALEVNVHDPKFFKKILSDVDELLSTIEHTKEIINDEYDHSDGEWTINETNIVYTAPNGKVLVEVFQSWDFVLNSIKKIENNTLFFYRSDPAVAFQNCCSKNCHYMINGQFHHCKTTALASTLEKQFAIDQHSKDIHARSTGMSAFDSEEKLDNFFNNLGNPIEQCRLCPENSIRDKVVIWPVKKIRRTF